MKQWIIAILSFFITVSFVINFTRVVVLTDGDVRPELLDVFSIVEAFERIDLPADDLFRDLKDTLDGIVDVGNTFIGSFAKLIDNPTGSGLAIVRYVTGLYNVFIAFFKMSVTLVRAMIDGVLFIYGAVILLYDLLNILLGVNFLA